MFTAAMPHQCYVTLPSLFKILWNPVSLPLSLPLCSSFQPSPPTAKRILKHQLNKTVPLSNNEHKYLHRLYSQPNSTPQPHKIELSCTKLNPPSHFATSSISTPTPTLPQTHSILFLSYIKQKKNKKQQQVSNLLPSTDIYKYIYPPLA